jgi:ADP-heptose:LPS heptosyltransferase
MTLETSFGELSALIEKCDLIIANDSGPMHVAAALGIPTIGIFGPTNPDNHNPFSANSDYVIKRDLHCIICNKLVCPYHHECMLELNPKDFVIRAKKLLNLV